MRDFDDIQEPVHAADQRQILVIGGGLGGIRTALDIAETGRNVTLVDKAHAIGGLMARLDRTFPTNNCDLCTLSPHLSASGRELHIDIQPLTQLHKLEGEAGDFSVTLETSPRHIDLAKCTACGLCAEKYPDCVKFTPGLDPRAPTCMRYPQATPYAFSIDMAKCEDIAGLVDLCPAKAIIPDDKPVQRQLKADAIVLAPGAELFDASVLDNFGGGRYPNVVSGLEYERIMSASGPTGGLLQRPSDGRQPAKVAWIQCVGSRGINKADVPYCSSVCCMYALKEAIITKERFQDDIETTLFYMDMRTFGKDYELYLNRAKNEHNVRLVRSRPHTVVADEATGNLSITYTTEDNPAHIQEEFDMVVLSTGFRVPADLKALCEKLGISLNEHDFAETSALDPVATSKPGIFVCGVFQSPKDIPETMVQASAAACRACEGLDEQALTGAEEFPPERDVTGEEPRVGVFVCDCGMNIGGVVDVAAVVKEAAGLPHVVTAEMTGHGCSQEAFSRIADQIKALDLNRIVIGGCSPRTHETKFQDVLRRAGLNPYLLEIANIRDQGSWVHMDDPAAATRKAGELIRMALGNVILAKPLKDHTLPMNKDILVVGGGVTGMTASLQLADQGFKVFLVEMAAKLGGRATDVRRTLTGEDVPVFVAKLIERVQAHDQIQVITRALIVDHAGMPGMFTTGIQVGPRMQYRRINHGVTILATGALARRPQGYLLDQHSAVCTQLELEAQLTDQPESAADLQTVVMIQCVGSRTADNPNCSRVCCQSAIKNALALLEKNPKARVFILYRDIRTYGFQEDYYRLAREKGVIFTRYDENDPPQVSANGEQIEIVFKDQILGRAIRIDADRLVLSTGFISDDEATEDMARIFHLPRTTDGYFLEDHVKLRPLDLPVKGFFVAGAAHSPKNIGECITQAQAAAGRAKTMLAKDVINLGGVVARVDGKKCAACLICVRACPYDVPFINADGYSEIDPAGCHGCGVCAAECPAKAITLLRFEDDQIMAKLDGLLEGIM